MMGGGSGKDGREWEGWGGGSGKDGEEGVGRMGGGSGKDGKKYLPFSLCTKLGVPTNSSSGGSPFSLCVRVDLTHSKTVCQAAIHLQRGY